MVKGKPWWSPKQERQRKIVADLLELKLDNTKKQGEKLPSIKQAETIFSEALTASCKPGLDETEAYRLQVVAELAKVYRDLAAGYVGYYLSGQNNLRRNL